MVKKYTQSLFNVLSCIYTKEIKMALKNVYVVGGTRTPFVKSMTFYRDISTQELMTETLKNLTQKFCLLKNNVIYL